MTVETPKLSKKSATIKVGKTLQLKLNGNTQKVTWESSKPSVATVSKKGKITAKKSGKCVVTATVSNKSYKCNITVKKPKTTTSEDTSSPAESEYVWLSATGSKYHAIPNCGRMNPDKARQITKKEALEYGYEACDKCF